MKISLVFILLCIISVFVGVQQIAWTSLFDVSSHTWLTLTASRLPRLVALTLTGVGLSVSGVILQQIVHNKFVEPSITGGVRCLKTGYFNSINVLAQHRYTRKNALCDVILLCRQCGVYCFY